MKDEMMLSKQIFMDGHLAINGEIPISKQMWYNFKRISLMICSLDDAEENAMTIRDKQKMTMAP